MAVGPINGPFNEGAFITRTGTLVVKGTATGDNVTVTRMGVTDKLVVLRGVPLFAEELAKAVLRHVCDDVAEVARPMGVEQSNTSVVFDERIILKVFRRLQDGRLGRRRPSGRRAGCTTSAGSSPRS